MLHSFAGISLARLRRLSVAAVTIASRHQPPAPTFRSISAQGFLFVAAMAGISSVAWAGGAEFAGSATSADGKTTATGNFEYNTQNNFGQTVLSQANAAALGLGTLDAATGVFTPNNDPSTGKPPIASDEKNNGTVHGYVYKDITIKVTGSDGKACSFKQDIFVAKNQAGANKVWASDNTLNAAWINAMKGGIFGAGATAKAFWPSIPPADAKPAKKAIDDNPSSDSRETFDVQLRGNDGTSNTLPMVYESGADFTYIPLAEAQALDLTLSPSPVDLSSLDPDDLAALSMDDLDEDGQTLFYEAVLPSLDDAFGLAPAQDDLTVLISDNANSEFGVLGANALGNYAYYSQVDPSNPDGSGEDEFLAAVPEPTSLAILGVALAGFGFARRHRNTI
jgi:hypothetical protein